MLIQLLRQIPKRIRLVPSPKSGFSIIVSSKVSESRNDADWSIKSHDLTLQPGWFCLQSQEEGITAPNQSELRDPCRIPVCFHRPLHSPFPSEVTEDLRIE